MGAVLIAALATPDYALAYQRLCVLGQCDVGWQESPYTISIDTTSFATQFGPTVFTSVNTVGMVEASVFAWQQLGIVTPGTVQFRTSGSATVTVWAGHCYNGDCTNSVLGNCGHPYGYGYDNCDISAYANPNLGTYSMDGSGQNDVQDTLTHEFGHCIAGLADNPPGAQETIMKYWGHGVGDLSHRFPMRDDLAGATDTSGSTSSPLWWRVPGGTWYPLLDSAGSNVTSIGSPGIAFVNRSGQWYHAIAWPSAISRTSSRTAYPRYLIEHNGGFSSQCYLSIPGGAVADTFDGVALAQDVGSTFAGAFRDSGDSHLVWVTRGYNPAAVGCQSAAGYQILGSTRRRPSLAWDPATSRLVVAYVDATSGRIKVQTSNSVAGAWTAAQELVNSAGVYPRSDTPPAIACGTMNGRNRCWLMFSGLTGTHFQQLYEISFNANGTINGPAVNLANGISGATQPMNVPATLSVSSDRLRILFSSDTDSRYVYEYRFMDGVGYQYVSSTTMPSFVGPSTANNGWIDVVSRGIFNL